MAKRAAATVAAAAPVMPGYEDHGDGVWTVTLIGNGPIDGTWQVCQPLPQTLLHREAMYILSDRAAGVYLWRHP